MDVKVKIEHEEVDLPDLIDPQSLSEEHSVPKHEIHTHTCSECLEDFNCEFLLKVHQMIHDKTQYCFICKHKIHNKFKEHVMDRHFNQCDVCFKTFNYKKNLVQHMEHHTGNLNYIKCDKRFRQRGSLISHMRSYHEGVKPYACKECDGTFTTSSSLDRHVKNVHNPNNPKHSKNVLTNVYDCDVCSTQFTNKTELQLHEKEHFESNKCKLCGKQYGGLNYLKLHTFLQHFKTERCTHCGKLFHKKTIEKHLRSHDKKKVITYCELCDQPFASNSILTRHLATHVTAQCKLCGMYNIKSMKNHLEAHRRGKVQKCSICAKFVSDIDVHNTNIHKNTEFLFCTVCPEKFTTIVERTAHNEEAHFEIIKCPKCKKQMGNSKLVDHVRKYHPELVYECDYCDQVLYGIATYNAHLESHKKVFKPYTCNKCLKSYENEANLKKHTCTALYYCHLCNKYYTSRHSYNSHMIQQHKPNIITATSTENLNALEIGGKKIYQCKKCFLTMFKLNRPHHCHHLSAILVRRIHHKCNLCGFLGATMGGMRRHCFKYHENETDWVTIKAAKGSNKKPQMRRNFIYKCHCGNAFQYESSLIKHR
uniref:Zinc finger protein 62 homolog n=1 Tax=Diabrotica virgifera virgifera TaxID=50390 RepID=A0A6P7G8G2_DIAVI